MAINFKLNAASWKTLFAIIESTEVAIHFTVSIRSHHSSPPAEFKTDFDYHKMISFLFMCSILSSREDLQQKKNSFVIFNFFLFSDIIFLHSPLLHSCGVFGYSEEEVFMEGGIMIYCQCLWMPIECWSWAEAKVISNSGFTESLLFLSVLFVLPHLPLHFLYPVGIYSSQGRIYSWE